MALQCNVSLSSPTMVAGQSPAPMATLTVYNPNAAAIAVAAIQMAYYDGVTGRPINAVVAPQMPAYGPGQLVVAAARTSITFGPMPVAMGSASNASSFPASGFSSGTQSSNQQLAQPPQTYILIGATVYGSDGSANEAGRAGLFVSFMPPPPSTFQGGFLQFNDPLSFVTGLEFGVL